MPVKVAGISMPLAPAFQGVVGAERQFLPVLGADKPFMAGAFVFSGPSLTGAIEEGADGTVLEIDCQERLYRATSNAPSLAEAGVTVFWSPPSCRSRPTRTTLDRTAHRLNSGTNLTALMPSWAEKKHTIVENTP